MSKDDNIVTPDEPIKLKAALKGLKQIQKDEPEAELDLEDQFIAGAEMHDYSDKEIGVKSKQTRKSKKDPDYKPRVSVKPPELEEGIITGFIVGRANKVIPPDQVEELAAMGCKDAEIANFFGITKDTLVYNFYDYLVMGREKLKISLRRAMLNNAIKNNNAALQIFLAKNLLGMSDNPVDSEANNPLPWDDSL